MVFFRTKSKSPSVPATPPGKRLYAIGDVHGCLEHLTGLLGLIRQEELRRGETQTYFVFLGDLIDRGPESAGVVEAVYRFCAEQTGRLLLRGNHEEMFLKAYHGDLSVLGPWLSYGGREALLSYGISQDLLQLGEPEQIHLAMRKCIPAHHIRFLEAASDCVEFGDYFLVHAGIDPVVPLSRQNRENFFWMREPFLSYPKPLEKIVVHGHTIEPEVTQQPHRIGLDTGAYAGGALSAVCLEGTSRHILSWKPVVAGVL
jgi:serine/threonine protein phosphatase 1